MVLGDSFLAMESSVTDEAVRDQGALNSQPSFTEKDFEGHREISVFAGGVHLPGQHGQHHHRRHKHHHHKHHKKDASDPSRPVTPPSQRVHFLLGEGEVFDAHPLFSELAELVVNGDEMEWRESARWIKFEEDVEEGGNRWSKPHVATLSLHSLFELRSCLLNGCVTLDMDGTSLDQIVDLIMDNMVNSMNLSLVARDAAKDILLCRHRHQHEKRHDNNKGSRIPLIRSLADIGRVHSSSKSPTDNNTIVKSPSGNSLSHNHLHPYGEGGLVVTSSSADIQQLAKGNQHFMKKVPPGAEAANILVGEVPFLSETVLTAFVRLSQATMLGDLTEVPVPTRFLFILLGPRGNSSRHHEIGRAMATLLSDEVFHYVAYKAKKREDLLAGIDEFLDAVTVLPPGEWDPSIRIEPPTNLPSQDHRRGGDPNKNHDDHDSEEEEEKERERSGLKRTGRLFGGLKNDLKRKAPFYVSDFKDACAIQCLASFFFLFFACLTPIITFGGLLGDATDQRMAAIESMIAGCVCGVIYALFSGQPLTILSSTGPVLVFESITYSICKEMELDYLSCRLWIGLWTGAILIILVAKDASAFVCYITRFTEENFACLISLIFIYNAIDKLYGIVVYFPPNTNPLSNSSYVCECKYLVSNYTEEIWGRVGSTPYEKEHCKEQYDGVLDGDGCKYFSDVALMSILGSVLTFAIAYYFKEFKNTNFFPAKIRKIFFDFAVIIAILTVSFIDYLSGIQTPKLMVPEEIKPTWSGRGWLINPLNVPWYIPIVAVVPAILATILIFMDQQITAVIINRKEHKLKKGGGYHLDLFVLAILFILCSIFGLPWFVAGTVLSVTHVNSLKVESECAAPGEKPQFLGVREQRVTHLLIFIMIGASVFMTPVLRFIPMPVLYGVFLYMGYSSLGGLQFFARILILFMPGKYQPDYMFLRQVPVKRIHLFTMIQFICLVCLWFIKSFKATSIAFPVMLVVIIAVRKSLDYVFTQEELKILDDIMPDQTKRKREEDKMIMMEESMRASRLEVGQTGDNFQITLANGNVVSIPVNQVAGFKDINISEELTKNSIWKQVNEHGKNNENKKDSFGASDEKTKSKHKGNKKRGSSKKDALTEEEKKRLSTMTEEDDDSNGPVTINIQMSSPLGSTLAIPHNNNGSARDLSETSEV